MYLHARTFNLLLLRIKRVDRINKFGLEKNIKIDKFGPVKDYEEQWGCDEHDCLVLLLKIQCRILK